MKVIFYDIDGVLNSDATPNPRDFPYVVDKRLLRRFKALLERTGAKAVMSSTWRVDPVGLCAARYFGIPIFDVCPDRPKSPRCNEVKLWLKRHPKVTRYAVIDDEDDELDELPLFQPSKRTGLTLEIARGVERYLAGETDATMRASKVKRLAENVGALLQRNKS
jgi:hypothetical protein